MNPLSTRVAFSSFRYIAALASLAACGSGNGSSPDAVGTSTAAISESTNAKTAFEYFVSKGLSKTQSAGIVGNLIQESDVDPTIKQYGGGPGRGIAQWSEGGRWNADRGDNVAWYASKEKRSDESLTLQLAFIWYELETFPGYGLSRLRDATNITNATVAFEDDFEGCGECDQAARIEFAQQVFEANGGHSLGGGKGCYSDTRGKEEPDNACVQSRANDDWYQCDDGDWVDRWTDPSACHGIYPL